MIKKFPLYLGDRGALERLLAVHPAVATRDALSPVVPPRDPGGEAGGVREAGALAGGDGEHGSTPGRRARVVAAVMRRRGPGEDAHHHVEGEQDLGQANPHVQRLLKSAKASDGGEDLVEIHRRREPPSSTGWSDELCGGREVNKVNQLACAAALIPVALYLDDPCQQSRNDLRKTETTPGFSCLQTTIHWSIE